MIKTILTVMLQACAVCIIAGCRLLVGTTVVAVGVVGLVGYGVYKTGETAVTSLGSAVSSVAGKANSIAFMDGEFKAGCDGTVEEVWLVSERTLRVNGFGSVAGKRDALSGYLQAVMSNGQAIIVKLEDGGQAQTHVRIRIGDVGDLKQSETFYTLVTMELSRQREAQQVRSL